MTILDFIFGILALIVILVMFISWLGVKYDIVERDLKTEELELELKKWKEKEEKRKKRRYKKSKENLKKKTNKKEVVK